MRIDLRRTSGTAYYDECGDHGLIDGIKFEQGCEELTLRTAGR